MKKVLSFLLSIVFLHAQTAPLFAHRGGPENSDTTANVDIVGTYSGTLIPDDPAAANTDTIDGSDSINSLGLFNLGVPTTGPATGTFLIFTQGIIFTGTIIAAGDAGKGTIQGVVEGNYDFTDFLRDDNGNIIIDNMGVPQSATFTATVRGTVFCNVISSAEFDPTDLASQFSSFSRIDGKAEMGVIFQTGATGVTNKVLRYTVDGTKQSASVDTGTSLNGALGGNSN